MSLDLLRHTSVTAVWDLIKTADVQWISGMDYASDDLGLDCKVGGVSGYMVLLQC